ncbi:hypothetical protein B0T10DRAFT_591834 [Thelonectria olida]|uniref:Uncharacterized protein n=1 Tax=Thelonectria olida TaxID=1576542 RepID=A0A9P9AUN3_9HYPO|nr:hypothetical protein B0T10DRAFT_591834 [Thelonectria olida]
MDYSSKQPRRSSVYGSSSRSKGSTSSGRHEEARPKPVTPALSFMFTVNELRIDINVNSRDEYHHWIPPTRPSHYTYEIPSMAMRYYDGQIRPLQGYQWVRNISEHGTRSEGSLMYQNQRGQWAHAVKYSACAVFACNPLLPIMVCPDDPYSDDTRSRWQLLQIFHPRQLPGVSQVAHEDSNMLDGPGLKRHVAGTRPSWMPSLIPASYQSPPLENLAPSQGLGGELAIVLGLMALTVEPDPNGGNNTHTVFLGYDNHPPKWRQRQWTSGSKPRGHPASSEYAPRGFLVTVFFDPANPHGSTQDWLDWFEWSQAIVIE